MKILFLEESNHLSYCDNPLVIGGWIINKKDIQSINSDLKAIKAKHGIKSLTEIKWTKIGKSKFNAYKELIEYALNNDKMQLRVLVAKRPSELKLTYKEWYTRLHFTLISKSPFKINGIVSDKKGSGNESELDDTVEISIGQPVNEYIPSHESQIIQISDLFLGAIASQNNKNIKSIYKKEIIKMISSKINISTTTSIFAK